MEKIKYEDRIYFAGFFDGEGCVKILKNNKKVTSAGNITVSYSLVVVFGITYKNTLVDMQKIFGGNIYEMNMKKRRESRYSKELKEAFLGSPDNWKQQYYYQLVGKDSLYFLKVIEPFCREKKDQVNVGIRYEEGKRPQAHSGGRSKSETDRCEFFYQELRRMKHELLCKNDIIIDYKDDQKKLLDWGCELWMR